MAGNDTMALWDRVFSTDPAQTKTFKKGGGFAGTAIKPYWIIMRATEEFGPVGVGWGWTELEHATFVAENGQALWMSKIQLWYMLDGKKVMDGPIQWGATELVALRDEGRKKFVDEEAAKKAVTDGLTKCLSYLGFAGDVHMGLFDDSKYVAQRKVEERKAREADDAADAKAKRAKEREEAEDAEADERDKRSPGVGRRVEGERNEPAPEVRDRNGEKPKVLKGDERLGFDKLKWAANVRAEIKKLKTEKAVRNYWAGQKETAAVVMETDEKLVEELMKEARNRLEVIKIEGDEL